MIELNINDGSYDRILDAPVEAEANVSAPDDIAGADKFNLPQDRIYPLAQTIVERGYYHRPLRRSSSIL